MAEYRLHGPPGTGKTRALSQSWVPRAAERFGARNVAICSLTRTAAREIASRDLPIPRENVGTLHAMAYRALGRPDIAEGQIAEWNKAAPMFKMGGARPSVDEPELKTERSTKGDELMARAQVYRHNRIPLEDWRHDVAMFEQRWRRWMEDEGLIDFTGLIEAAAERVFEAPGAPSVFVVDEAQDCSQLELDLVRKWAARAEYAVLAGDGDQAIYGWRGASARAFLGPQIPEDHNYHLTQSYRVPKAVHRAAVRWIERASYRYAVDYEPRDYEGSVELFDGNARNVMPLIRAAQQDAEEGKSVMILASCGYMIAGIVSKLKKQGIPFFNPFRPSHGGWNPLRGGAPRLLDFLRPDSEAHDYDCRPWSWEEAQRWTEIVQSKGTLKPSAKAWIRRLGKDEEKARDLITPESGASLFVEEWSDLMAMMRGGGTLPLDWLEQRLLSSKRSMMSYPLAIARRPGGKKLLKETPKICVGTIHSVKGGQADVVYLLPDLSPSGLREWGQHGDGKDGIIRTFYVGMTRARETLRLCGRWSGRSVNWGLAL